MISNQYIIRHLDDWRINWELFIIILALYNAGQLPFDIAFSPPLFRTDVFDTINNIIDISFVIDMIFSFRTTYQDQWTGDEVYDPKEIAKNYFYG